MCSSSSFFSLADKYSAIAAASAPGMRIPAPRSPSQRRPSKSAARPSATPETKRSEAEITIAEAPTPATATRANLVNLRRAAEAARSALAPIRSRT